MKLLKKITAEPRQVKRGQPFKIKVTPNNIPDKEIYVQINGRWGTQQILQFDGLPGERVVLIRAYTDDKRVFEDRKVKITVLPEEQPGSKGIILPEIHPQVPATLRLTFLRPLAQTVPNNGFYEWFINGQKVTTQATTEGFIDLNSQMNHRQMFTEFEAKLIERKEDGTILAKYSQYVYLASPYHMIKKQAGILIPPVENDFLLNVIRAGYIYYNFSIQNVEDYSLSFKTVQFEFLNNNPDAINVFQQEDMSEPFVVPASGKKQYDGVLKANKLPADTGGFIIRLIGVSDTGIPVKSVAHFEFALQMRNETFKVDRVEINRWLWQERPWEMVIRGIAKEYFVNNRAVQNGTANISHLKRLFSMHIEGVKRSLNTVKTAAPAIAGVEITDTKVNAAINQISTPATTPNIAASQQLYQTVIRLRTFARTATGAPGRHATVPDNDADALSQESLDALRDFNLESLVPGSVFDAVSARTMEGMECQPDEDAPAEI